MSFNSCWALALLNPSTLTQVMSLYCSWVASTLHHLCACLLAELRQESPVHAHCPSATLARLPTCQNGLFSCSDEDVLEGQPTLLGPFALQAGLLWHPVKQVPEQAIIFSPEGQACGSTIYLAAFYRSESFTISSRGSHQLSQPRLIQPRNRAITKLKSQVPLRSSTLPPSGFCWTVGF